MTMSASPTRPARTRRSSQTRQRGLAGFFFTGVLPCAAPAGDALCLTYLAVPLDVTQLQIASPFGQELVAYAAAERDRIAAARD